MPWMVVSKGWSEAGVEEGGAYRFQRNLATAVLALFSASFLWYALKAIYLAVFGS